MRAERLSTDFPFVSLTLFSMTDKIACSDFSSCRTLLIGAKELRRIFLGFCVLHTFTAYPLMRFFPTQWEILPPDKGALPDCLETYNSSSVFCSKFYISFFQVIFSSFIHLIS